MYDHTHDKYNGKTYNNTYVDVVHIYYIKWIARAGEKI